MLKTTEDAETSSFVVFSVFSHSKFFATLRNAQIAKLPFFGGSPISTAQNGQKK